MPTLLVVDIETYYDREYSLSKITTEEYIRSDLYETIGVSVQIGDTPTVWYPQPKVEAALKNIDWSDKMVVGQNTAFDGGILAWRYGIKPLALFDTMGMSRALYPHEKSHSLKAQAERHGVGVKGDEVVNALGKRYADFSKEDLAKYGEYCNNDVLLTRKLFDIYMGMGFSKQELQLIDLTLRMYTEPVLQLDAPLLVSHLQDTIEKKAALVDTVKSLMPDSDYKDDMKAMLMSNDIFAKALQSLGVDPPMKISARTGKLAYAFAKTDEEFIALEDHPDVRVQALVAARLGNKTTIEETRTERFLAMSARGAFPVPLRYYGAHSGRWSGQDSINLQNLPSRGANAGKIKKAIRAPEGYVFIDCDSSQIEARTLAWLAGQTDLVQAFENKEDVYKIMASRIYNKLIEDITPSERFLGKTVILGCFGPDTNVLTSAGWKRIVEVTATDMLWDGEAWVTHQGVIPQGKKEVLTAHGISATSDHEILTGHGWVEWSEALKDPFLFQSALAKGNLPSSLGSPIPTTQVGLLGGTLSLDAHAAGKGEYLEKTLRSKELLDVTLALNKLVVELRNTIGGTKQLSQMQDTELGYLTGLLRVLIDAVIQSPKRTVLMGAEGYSYGSLGGLTEQNFLLTLCRSLDGIIQNWSLTVSTTTRAMNRVILDGLLELRTWLIGALSMKCKERLPTYDIAYAGPRNRYTVATDAGPIIVHNCGYGVGHVKLRATLKQAGVEIDEEEATRIIDAYRSTYSRIPDLWKSAGRALQVLVSGQTMQVDIPGIIHARAGKGFTLPNGLYLQYPGLERVINEEGKTNWRYWSKGLPVNIYGGKVVENICQAVARCIIGEQMLRIAKRYKVVLTVHDAVGIVARQEEAHEARAYVEACMSWRPKWAQSLPLACESGMGATYGDC